jgi:4-hydroxy-2-oxoheptanedioate aldolase
MKATLRQLWDSGEPSLGGWCATADPFIAEIMADCFDWVCIDTQHGLAGQETMVAMLQALQITATPGFVRVPSNEPAPIMRALDAGAAGVIVPMVNSADDVRAAIAAARYPPSGNRSWGPSRQELYATGSPEELNRQTVCVVMVETEDAVAQLDSILEVDGIDGIFVGPSDLAVSMGLDPNASHGLHERDEVVLRILDNCRRRKVIAGIYCGGAAQAIRWRDAGFRMLAVHTDARLLRAAAQAVIQEVRGRRVSDSAAHKEGAGYV